MCCLYGKAFSSIYWKPSVPSPFDTLVLSFFRLLLEEYLSHGNQLPTEEISSLNQQMQSVVRLFESKYVWVSSFSFCSWLFRGVATVCKLRQGSAWWPFVITWFLNCLSLFCYCIKVYCVRNRMSRVSRIVLLIVLCNAVGILELWMLLWAVMSQMWLPLKTGAFSISSFLSPWAVANMRYH